MQLRHLELRDFRCYRTADVSFGPGVTVITGANAQGKTTLLEAIAWVATSSSFRRVADSALVRAGEDTAVVRAEVVDGTRSVAFEAEIVQVGRKRVHLNGKPIARSQDRRAFFTVTVFAPDDLVLVKGAPSARRNYLDEMLVTTAPRFAGVCSDYQRVLRQRNALLRQGIRGSDDERTLEVFDVQLACAGGELVRGRLRLLDRLTPLVGEAYKELAGEESIDGRYESAWLVDVGDVAEAADVLLAAVHGARRAELARGTTLVGPHRDDWRLGIASLDSRVHASQGQQRTLALALKLGAHRLATELRGTAPVLLLDDVFSELDEARATALLGYLGSAQTLVTTAGSLPRGLEAERVLLARGGQLVGR